MEWKHKSQWPRKQGDFPHFNQGEEKKLRGARWTRTMGNRQAALFRTRLWIAEHFQDAFCEVFVNLGVAGDRLRNLGDRIW